MAGYVSQRYLLKVEILMSFNIPNIAIRVVSTESRNFNEF